MSTYFTSKKKTIMLSPTPLGKGGEGEVYTLLVGPINQCAKIYFLNQRTKEREDKINFIVSNIPIQQNNGRFLLCMPTETLFDAKGKFVGFLMPKAFDNSVQLYKLVNITGQLVCF